MISSSSSNLVVVESVRSGMRSETFKDRLHAVCCILNNGAIGGGASYGCDEHVAALDAVEKHIAEVRQNIVESNADDWVDPDDCELAGN